LKNNYTAVSKGVMPMGTAGCASSGDKYLSMRYLPPGQTQISATSWKKHFRGNLSGRVNVKQLEE